MADAEWRAALVTFERQREGVNAILPDWAWGACGWMAVRASSEDESVDLLASALKDDALNLLEVDEWRAVQTAGDLSFDPHLALNFGAIDAGAVSVWGTLHGYKGEGET